MGYANCNSGDQYREFLLPALHSGVIAIVDTNRLCTAWIATRSMCVADPALGGDKSARSVGSSAVASRPHFAANCGATTRREGQTGHSEGASAWCAYGE
jgi:hypothetical protein